LGKATEDRRLHVMDRVPLPVRGRGGAQKLGIPGESHVPTRRPAGEGRRRAAECPYRNDFIEVLVGHWPQSTNPRWKSGPSWLAGSWKDLQPPYGSWPPGLCRSASDFIQRNASYAFLEGIMN
jgi:hypothetical protein